MTVEGDEAPKFKFCSFYFEKKKRPCKQQAIRGQEFCGLHIVDATGAGEARVMCPYGKHTVPASALERHKKSCPERLLAEKLTSQPSYKKGINAGSGAAVTLPDAPPELADKKGQTDTIACKRQALITRMGPDAFNTLLARVDAVHSHLGLGILPQSIRLPPQAEPYIVSTETFNRPYTPKHAVQQASIVGNMEARGMLQRLDETVFIEFGAGKGYLTCMLADCFPQARNLVMMDVRSFSLTADRSLRDRNMQRLRCDIADFDPLGIQGLEPDTLWVGHGKHLCGPATDFTLRCCARYVQTGLKGLAVASCCHHLTTWQHYVGQEIITELGFSPEEFELIAYTCGWATCGHGSQKETNINTVEADTETEKEEEEEEGCEGTAAGKKEGPWRPHYTLSRAERMALGWKCKRLVDYGRAEWLCRQGFVAEGVQYVAPEVSGENLLLIGVPAREAG